MKYTVTRPAALRVAAAIVQAGYPTTYDDALRAIDAEGFANDERALTEVINQLKREADDEDSKQRATARAAHDLLADACAREARDGREKLRAIRRAFSLLGVAFCDEIKSEALINE